MNSSTHRAVIASVLVAIVLIVGSARSAVAQCASFSGEFGAPGLLGNAHAMVEFDDGRGPALYVGGSFGGAGRAKAYGIGRWDGTHWEALGEGVNGWVTALAVFDDGSGPALYAGGNFTTAGGLPALRIAKWNGTTWSTLGPGVNSGVTSMVVFNDGSGPALYVAGPLMAGTVLLGGVGKWNGTTWSSAGDFGSSVYALALHDFGGGAPLLVAGGAFLTVNSLPIKRIAVGNGSVWQPIGNGFDDTVRSLTSFNSALIAGGQFNYSGTTNVPLIARWTGSTWAPLGAGFDGIVYSLHVHDFGSGARLLAGGNFLHSGTTPTRALASWDGSAWSEFGGGCEEYPTVMHSFPSSGPSALFVGGLFREIGGVIRPGIARWSGSWAVVSEPTNVGAYGEVRTAITADLGTGSKLYCGGSFEIVGTTAARRVAAWDGTTWSALGTGVGLPTSGRVDALALYNDGTGQKLFAGGDFVDPTLTVPSRIAAWDGSTWSWVGFGTDNAVTSLCVFTEPAGPRLFVGGVFSNASGIPAARVARWDGTTWTAVGAGVDATVNSMAVYDDGSGPALFVAGNFTHVEGVPCGRLAKWNGTQWTAISPGLDGSVLKIAVLDDGSGPALYLVGNFATAGGVPSPRIARYRNGVWSALGAGPSIGNSITIGAWNDGSGPALYAGALQFGGGTPTELSMQIAKWDGLQWTNLPERLKSRDGAIGVNNFCAFDPGTGKGASLFVLGVFSAVDSMASLGIAEYRGCANPFQTQCSGDGSAAPCPCTNTGAAGHGCAHSANAAGARLAASGTPRVVADSLQLTTTDALNGPGLFFQGTTAMAAGNGIPFGDGLLCAGGTIVRLGIAFATGNSAHFPNVGVDPAVSVAGACVTGNSYTYQVWYRDSDPLFCSSAFFNITNAVSFTWRP